MMKQEEPLPLVSILTPVYNGKAFLDRFLRCILEQAYPRIELVLVDDGSTDGSFDTAENYVDAFQRRGYSLRCFRQEHAGAAAAINRGLAEFTGEYLKWMDCDDLLEPTCIEEQMEFLKAHPEYGFTICDSRYVENGNLEETLRIFGRKTNGKDDYFRDILRGTHNYSLGSGTILVSRENLLHAIPMMQIYASMEGQNYQLMLPLTYHFTCGYLRRPVFRRVLRNDSHSKMTRSYQEQKERCDHFIVLMKETVRRMHILEEEEAFDLIDRRFTRQKFLLAYENGDLREAEYCGALLHKKKRPQPKGSPEVDGKQASASLLHVKAAGETGG